MPDLPHLIFPAPHRATRRMLSGFGGGRPVVDRPAQRRRLEPKFATLVETFRRRRLEVTAQPALTDPEDIVVLETVGRVEDFARAVRRVDGLEWLGDFDIEDVAPDDDYHDAEEPTQLLPGRLYVVASNQEGLDQLLSLWRLYVEEGAQVTFPYGLTPLREVFALLHDIRRWGPTDRIAETGLDADYERRLEAGQMIASLELELWYREQPTRRQDGRAAVVASVEAAGGSIISEALIAEISYHALLAELPIQEVDRIRAATSRVVNLAAIMHVRPIPQFVDLATESAEGAAPDAQLTDPEGEPIVALLDGLPVEQHVWLAGRLSVDDPDGWAATYPTAERRHGTGMASLIVHGELDAPGPPIRTPLYVRPVLRPSDAGFGESVEYFPEDRLPLDLVNEAVVRIVDEVGGVARSVRVVCHALADPSRPFDGSMGAWARLLDYLSWRYRILFVIAAGNRNDWIEFDEATGTLPGQPGLERNVIRSLIATGRTRPVLSPGESINSLTIGAIHDDASPGAPAGQVDPYNATDLPSPATAQGRGFRRSIKPDIALPGGRIAYRDRSSGSRIRLQPIGVGRAPGHRIAAPGQFPGDLNRDRYAAGTSNATALAARGAARLWETLRDLRNGPGNGAPEPSFDSVLLKALLVHSAEPAGLDAIDSLGLASPAMSTAMKLSGYGLANPIRALYSDDSRVTVIGWGLIGDGEGDRFELPIPPSLSGVITERSLIATLAWLTPVRPRHIGYRGAYLWYDPYWDGGPHFDDTLRLRRRNSDWQRVRRGTVQHEIFVGGGALSLSEDAAIQLQVNCLAENGSLDEAIPYGLVVTLDVRASVALPVYAEIRDRLRARVTVQP